MINSKLLYKFTILFIIIAIFATSLYCMDWQADAAGMAVTAGGTYKAEGKTIVQDGVILDYNYFYKYGATDADIAQWQAEAATNGVNASSSSSTPSDDTQASTISNDNSINSTDNANSSNNSSTQAQAVTQPSYTDEEIEAAWEETNRVESTCTEAGYIEYKNTLTGDTKTEALDLIDHDYVESERVEATCTEDGSVTKVCSICGDTYTESISATGHTTDNWITTKEPGLFSEGLKQEVCPVCGEVLAEQTIPQTCPIPLYAVIILVVAIAVLVVVVVYKLSKLRKKQDK